jgi:hypothetical protein
MKSTLIHCEFPIFRFTYYINQIHLPVWVLSKGPINASPATVSCVRARSQTSTSLPTGTDNALSRNSRGDGIVVDLSRISETGNASLINTSRSPNDSRHHRSNIIDDGGRLLVGGCIGTGAGDIVGLAHHIWNDSRTPSVRCHSNNPGLRDNSTRRDCTISSVRIKACQCRRCRVRDGFDRGIRSRNHCWDVVCAGGANLA